MIWPKCCPNLYLVKQWDASDGLVQLGHQVPVLLVEGLSQHDPQQVENIRVTSTLTPSLPPSAQLLLNSWQLLSTGQADQRRQLHLTEKNILTISVRVYLFNKMCTGILFKYQGCRSAFIFCGSISSCFIQCGSESSFTKLRYDFKLCKKIFYEKLRILLRLTTISPNTRFLLLPNLIDFNKL